MGSERNLVLMVASACWLRAMGNSAPKFGPYEVFDQLRRGIENGSTRITGSATRNEATVTIARNRFTEEIRETVVLTANEIQGFLGVN